MNLKHGDRVEQHFACFASKAPDAEQLTAWSRNKQVTLAAYRRSGHPKRKDAVNHQLRGQNFIYRRAPAVGTGDQEIPAPVPFEESTP